LDGNLWLSRRACSELLVRRCCADGHCLRRCRNRSSLSSHPADRRLAVRIRLATTPPDGSPTPNAFPAASTHISACSGGRMVAQQPTRHDVMPAPSPHTLAMLRQERYKDEAYASWEVWPPKTTSNKNFCSCWQLLHCWGEHNEAAAAGLPGRAYGCWHAAAAASTPSGRTPRP
jgi:hypothetical protein